MSAQHHSKVEHFLIHVVAILFLFFTVSAGFLGYGVYQTSQQEFKPQTLVQPKAAKAAGPNSLWTQNSWTGGLDGGSTYTVDWGSTGGWNKYSSDINADISSSGVREAVGGSSELVSSIFDLGSKRLSGIGVNTFVTESLRGGSSISAVQSASWSNNCQTSYRYVQYKLADLPTGIGDYVSSVSLSSALVTITGAVSDASTGNLISGASVSYGGNSTTTALHLPNNSWPIKNVVAAGPQPGYYNLNFEYDSSVNSYSVTASASGYQNQTKTVTANIDGGCNFATTANFSLTKTSSSSSSSNTSTSNSTAAISEPSVSTAEFQDTTLPKIFTTKGSKTTDLSKIKDPKKVKDFTIHIPGKSKIIFKDTLNLAEESTVAALKKLDKYLLMDKVGIVDLDSKTLKALNKKAIITMEGLKFVRVPDVLVDGKRDVKKIANNEKYDKKTGALTFDVNHFTAFWAVPKLVIITTTASIIANPNDGITAAISDANATVTGRFNGTKLADMKPDENGEFTIKKISLKEGANLLKLEAESSLGKVLALETNIPYNPNGKVDQQKPIYQEAAFLYAALSAVVIALVLGYLVYRRRKRHDKLKAKSTREEKPKEELQNLPEEEKKQKPTQ